MNEDILQAPPHAIPAEKTILSLLLQWPSRTDEILELGITEEHFYLPSHRTLFAGISLAIESGRSVDLVDLIQWFLDNGQLDRVGGPSTLADIYTYSPSFNPAASVKTLQTKLILRKAITLCRETQQLAYDNPGEHESTVDALDRGLTELSFISNVTSGNKLPRTTKQLVSDSVDRFFSRIKGQSSPMGIPTGIVEIDEAIYGLHPGRIMVIGAYPSGGKSAIASQICVNLAMESFHSHFVSLEMSEDDLCNRFLIQASNVPALAFSNPTLYATLNQQDGPTKRNLQHIQRAALKMAEGHFSLYRPSRNSLPMIVASIRKARREREIHLAVVDYLQLIEVFGQSNREQQMSEISHSLRALAVELGITILILSQLNVTGDTKHGRVVEEDADAFLQIVQEMDKAKDNFKEHQHVLVAKDRHNSQGGSRLKLIFDKQTVKFISGEPEKIEKQASKRNFKEY